MLFILFFLVLSFILVSIFLVNFFLVVSFFNLLMFNHIFLVVICRIFFLWRICRFTFVWSFNLLMFLLMRNWFLNRGRFLLFVLVQIIVMNLFFVGFLNRCSFLLWSLFLLFMMFFLLVMLFFILLWMRCFQRRVSLFSRFSLNFFMRRMFFHRWRLSWLGVFLVFKLMLRFYFFMSGFGRGMFLRSCFLVFFLHWFMMLFMFLRTFFWNCIFLRWWLGLLYFLMRRRLLFFCMMIWLLFRLWSFWFLFMLLFLRWLMINRLVMLKFLFGSMLFLFRKWIFLLYFLSCCLLLFRWLSFFLNRFMLLWGMFLGL